MLTEAQCREIDRWIAALDHRSMICEAKMSERITILAELVRDGIITIEVAAKFANMTTAAFSMKAGIDHIPQSESSIMTYEVTPCSTPT